MTQGRRLNLVFLEMASPNRPYTLGRHHTPSPIAPPAAYPIASLALDLDGSNWTPIPHDIPHPTTMIVRGCGQPSLI